jgi:predicted  nucleic acid-binding Zn-ribbon protein
MDVHSWSDYALNLANSAANIIGIIAAAVVLIAIALIYFTGSELTERAKGKLVTPQQNQTKALRQSQAELAAARRSEETKVSRLKKVETDLAAAQKSEQATSLRLSQIETELTAAKDSQESMASRLSKTVTELAAARRSTDEKTLLLSQAEAGLAAARKSEEEKTLRLSQLEAELAIARRSAEEAETLAKQLAKQLEQKQGPRKITPEQRTEFLNAIRGMPTGKVIVSAFFDNKETREFGAQILSLLKEDGFELIQRAPLNFFTTSRPSSGVRIGCENISDPPPHFTTVRQGLKAMGLDARATTLINAREEDVVEIQVTPRQ